MFYNDETFPVVSILDIELWILLMQPMNKQQHHNWMDYKEGFPSKVVVWTTLKKWKASISPCYLVTWRYLSWRAAGDCSMICEASRKALEALISPSAAITLARASRLASASAAMALWSCSGNLASFLKN